MDGNIINNLSSIIDNKLTYQKLSERERPLKTGFEMLDKYLEGGITPGLIVLGAGPGQGKSTFSLQLAEHISGNENVPVLYFSLEMTEDRVAAKTMTMDSFRHAKHEGFPVNCFQNGEEAKKQFFSASELFNPEKLEALTDDKRQQVEGAQTRVAENKNLYIIDKPYCAREIVETVDAFIKTRMAETEDTDQPLRSPMVIVDYLQILPPDPDAKCSFTDKQQVDLNLKVLRALVRENIPVLLISSLKRGNYSGKGTGPMRMDSFKETGGIEYSADVLMGLQFTACYQKGGCNPDDEKKKYPRDMELIILKQRYGSTDVGIPLRYYAEFDYFEEKNLEEPNDKQAEKAEKHIASSSKTAELTAEAQKQTRNEETCDDTQAEPTAEAQKQALNEEACDDTQAEPTEDSDVSCESQAETSAEDKPVQKRGRKKQKRGEIAYMNNTKIAYEIRNGHGINGKTARCNVAARKKEPIFTEFVIDGSISCFDCDVADAVYSIHRTGRKEFLLRHVMQALSGDEQQTLTDRRRQEIQESLDRLRNAEITITCTQEMVEMWHKSDLLVDDKVVIRGKFLAAEEEDGKYRFDDKGPFGAMPLYFYGEITRYMIAVPKQLMTVYNKDGRKISDTADNTMIKRYLIRRLEVIRKGKAPEHMRRVNYYSRLVGEHSGMLAVMGIKREDYESSDWEKKLERTHKTVTMILNSYKKRGYIDGYTEKNSEGVELSGKVNDPYKLEFE